MPTEQGIEEFGTESPAETIKVEKKDVTGQDIFKLAKQILFFCAIIFVIISTLRAFLSESKGISDVWEFSKIILNSITSLVLGLYFGRKEK